MTSTLHRCLAALEAGAGATRDAPTITRAEIEAMAPAGRTGIYRRVVHGQIRLADVAPLRCPYTCAEIEAMTPAEKAAAYRALRVT